MNHKKFYTLALLLVLVFAAGTSEAKKRKSGPYYVSAKSAILSDASRVKTLYGKNVHRRVLPASTTKVMTAILVMEKLPLDRYVTVSSKAAKAPPSIVNLRPGERYRVADLLYAILLNSANDAAIVLAEAVAGSEWKFVQMMNERSRQLGAQNTKFANASGLPTKKVQQHTTAYDMYLIFRHALKYDFFKRAIRLQHKTILSASGRKLFLKSHNKIFSFDWKSKVYGKTGYTRAAQACFVGAVEKSGKTLIVAVFGCSKRWTDIKHIISRYGGVWL